MYKIFTLICLLAFSSILHSQNWTAVYGSPLQEKSPKAIQLSNGDLVIVSSTGAVGSQDVLVKRIDTNGIQIWSTIIGTPADETPVDLMLHENPTPVGGTGDIFIVGNAMMPAPRTDQDIFIFRIHQDGTFASLSQNYFGNPGDNESASQISWINRSSGNGGYGNILIAGGTRTNFNGSTLRAMLWSYMAPGWMSWGRELQFSSANTWGGGVVEGSTILYRYGSYQSTAIRQGFICPISSNPINSGAINNVITVPLGNENGIHNMVYIPGTNDEFIISTYGTGLSPYQGVTLARIKLIPGGANTVLWRRNYTVTGMTSGFSSANKISILNGNIIFSADGTMAPANGSQMFLGSINAANGDINWLKTLKNATGNELSSSNLFLSNGNIQYFCQTSGFNTANGDFNIATAQTDSNRTPGSCEDTLSMNNISLTNPNLGTASFNMITNETRTATNLNTIQDQTSYSFACGACIAARVNGGLNRFAKKSYTQLQYFSGKYYVPDGDTITFSGQNDYDFTNCDVIFGRCSGFIFKSGARLRANNSVFRTCLETEKWRGMIFLDSSVALINESTFKNATKSLSFEGTIVEGKISNNLFFNNYVSISILNNLDFNGSISGNAFEIDNPLGTYNLCENISPYIGNFIGIQLTNSKISGAISQNRFVNNNISNPALYTGVDGVFSTLNLTSNEFSNNTMSISLQGVTTNKQIQIENNKIEVTNKLLNFTKQIRLASIDAPVRVFNNELTSSIVNKQGIWQSAIYTEGNSAYHDISSNRIKGFDVGIELNTLISSQILENEISNCKTYGIYSDMCTGLDISCNKINLDYTPETNNMLSLGIGIYIRNLSLYGPQQSKIQSNCIFDCRSSIIFENNVNSQTLPLIRNNYLYNYIESGIQNFGYTGSIGAMGSPGMNTFYSNNTSANDINSFPGIISQDNFLSTSFVGVTIAGSMNKHSITSCGHQISGNTSQTSADPSLVCDNLNSTFFHPLKIVQGGGFSIDNSFNGSDINYVKERTKEEIISSIIMVTELDKVKGNILLTSLNNQTAFNTKTKLFFNYNYLIAAGQFKEALEILSQITPDTGFSSESLQIEKLMVELKLNQTMTSSEIFTLNQLLFNKSVTIRNQATGLLNSDGFHYEYINETNKFPMTFTNPSETFYVNKEKFEVFPNPANDIVNIISFSTTTTNPKIELYDILGNLIVGLKCTYQNTTTSIDISQLSSGIYIVSVIDNNGDRKSMRFVKK